jgi:predicted GNAT family acetyltransferase
MTNDRTGAPTHVTAEPGRFSISVNGQRVGIADFVDRDGRRIFPHTEVNRAFQGRGLATILVREALEATRPTGLRVVPQCWMVAEFIEKNPEFADLVGDQS